jgi:DNA/RNA-binding domain of Phe-tRNA-synthetase-like protein
VSERAVEVGWVAPELAEELPGLGLASMRVAARSGRSPAPVRQRMKELASRITGAKVVQSRQDSVPWAYRVLWRRLGLDPDRDRTPIEALMVERLRHGGLASQGMPGDAAITATLETGVPVAVFDADRVGDRVGLRPARAGESLGADVEIPLRAGEVVYADERQPLARLTGEVASACAVSGNTTAMLLCALSAAGVPDMALEEALWIAADLLEASAGRPDR